MALEPIVVRTGDEFAVRLTGTPATGYVWQLRALPDGLRLLGSAYDTAAGAPPGSPSVQVWRVRAERAGQYELVFSLQRRWESEPIERQTLAVRVT